MSKPVVAIVGRPNVGKSTLFNRLVGARKAIVEDIPGVTRDRLYDSTDWAGHEFIIIDTGGIRFDQGDVFTREVKLQAELAIEESDVIIFVVDTKDGITHEDEQVADLLRKSNRPVVLAANKVENFDKQFRNSKQKELQESFQLVLDAYCKNPNQNWTTTFNQLGSHIEQILQDKKVTLQELNDLKVKMTELAKERTQETPKETPKEAPQESTNNK